MKSTKMQFSNIKHSVNKWEKFYFILFLWVGGSKTVNKIEKLSFDCERRQALELILNKIRDNSMDGWFCTLFFFPKLIGSIFGRSRPKHLTVFSLDSCNLELDIGLWHFVRAIYWIDFNSAVNRWQFVFQIKSNKMLLQTEEKYPPAPVLMSGG